MLVLNEAQALIVESLLLKLLINDPYSVSQLEEALTWFQSDRTTVSCPMETVFAQNLAGEIVRLLQQQS